MFLFDLSGLGCGGCGVLPKCVMVVWRMEWNPYLQKYKARRIPRITMMLPIVCSMFTEAVIVLCFELSIATPVYVSAPMWVPVSSELVLFSELVLLWSVAMWLNILMNPCAWQFTMFLPSAVMQIGSMLVGAMASCCFS